MLTKGELSAIGCIFALGLATPILLSGISMMISFGFGLAAMRILVPLSHIRDLDESAVLLGNGFLYAGIALVGVLLRKALLKRRQQTR